MYLPELDNPKYIKILVVDDEEEVRKLISDFLSSEGYQIYTASNGKEALKIISEKEPDIVLIDYMMPELDGISLCKTIKNNPDTIDMGVILITGINDMETRLKGLSAGADDFLNKPIFFPELITRIKSLSKIKKYRDFLKNYQHALEEEVEKKTAELRTTNLRLHLAYNEIKKLSLEVIHLLAKTAEYRDKHTGYHIQRVSEYCVRIAKYINLSQEEIELIKYASPLHDIGKLGIPDKILLKPGPLTPEEREIMKLHPIIGAKILEGSENKYLQVAEKIALYHHEKWDGTGYPTGLKKEKIPLFARITAIADVFDALTSDRPYRKAISVRDAFEIIKIGRGTHFDPYLVDVFFKIKDEILEIRELFKDEEEHILHFYSLYDDLNKYLKKINYKE
ncbi:MAG: two-component system response regulator [Thermodesulfobacteriota bacterium]|nr:MAG: two-component system response regulator [Thermodesulfobacteriota bacterium]